MGGLLNRTIGGLLTLGLWLSAAQALALERNGFVLDGALVPVSEIRPGGPPRDGIPAILRPRFLSAAEAADIGPDERVLGYAEGAVARAYPISILNWHEVVNDRVNGHGLLVTYCPLCGSGMAFQVNASDRFGVSGLLYNSDVLLYDHATESLWSQIMATAVTGPRRGEALTQVKLRHTTWAAWRAQYPDTLVLAPPSGRHADYTRNPYEGYERSRRLYFPVAERDRSLHPKARVLGVTVNGESRAWPLEVLGSVEMPLDDTLGGRQLRVHYDPASTSAWVEAVDEATGQAEELPSLIAFWFAWYAFHPDTSVYSSDTKAAGRQ